MDPHRELVQRLKENQEEAFIEFAEHFGPAALWVARRARIPETEALDLAPSWVHDVLLKVKAYNQKEGATFANWVFRLFRNAAADWWRARGKVEFEELNEQLADPASGPEGPLEACETTEKILAVRNAVRSLEEQPRRVVDLHIDGNSFAEIAAALGISEVNARVIYHRALKRLRKSLENDPRISN
jgi:RNA polymerase sigma factor (sigma-70 family)